MFTTLAQATFTTSTSSSGDMGAVSPVIWIVYAVFVIAMIAAVWKIFAKAGQPGWAAIIPYYNTVVMFHITGRSGWLLLALVVPIWNIYVAIRLVFELAKSYGRGIGFGFGLLFLAPIFILILAFGSSEYVGPAGKRPATSFPAGGFAPAPIAP